MIDSEFLKHLAPDEFACYQAAVRGGTQDAWLAAFKIKLVKRGLDLLRELRPVLRLGPEQEAYWDMQERLCVRKLEESLVEEAQRSKS